MEQALLRSLVVSLDLVVNDFIDVTLLSEDREDSIAIIIAADTVRLDLADLSLCKVFNFSHYVFELDQLFEVDL